MRLRTGSVLAAALFASAPELLAGEISKVRYKLTRFEVSASTPLPVLANQPDQDITVIGQGVNGLTSLECPPNTSCGIVFRNPVAPEIEFPLNATNSAIGQTLTVKIKYALGDSNTFKIKVFAKPSVSSVAFVNATGQTITEAAAGQPVTVSVKGLGLAQLKRNPGAPSLFAGVAVSAESILSATDTELKVRATPGATGNLTFLLGALVHPIGAAPIPGSQVFPSAAPPAPLVVKAASGGSLQLANPDVRSQQIPGLAPKVTPRAQ